MQVRAADTIAIAGGLDARGPASEAQASGIRSTTSAGGEGGTILLEANTIHLTQGAVITSSSNGTGNAGSIRLTARDTFLSEQSAVTTEAAQADGGNIDVTARTRVELRDSNLTAAVQGGADTAGGNITIGSQELPPEAVVLRNSRVDTTATDGQGGNIQITAEVFLQDTDSVVDAHSDRGIDGEVEIEAITNLHGLLEALPKNFMTAATLLRSLCAAQLREGTVSSLVVRERDGIPATPKGILPSRLAVARQATPPPNARHNDAATQQAGQVVTKTTRRLHAQRQPAANRIPKSWRIECAGLDSPGQTAPQ